MIVPTHQRRDPLRRALRSLARQTAPPESFEVIVSVDGSTDGTREMLASIRDELPYALHAVDGPGHGRAAARNVALAAAQGDVAILIDDDMDPVPAFVERHLEHHLPGSRVCVLGPVPIRLDATSPLAARYVKAKFDAHLERLAEPEHRFATRDFYSGNTSIRSEVLREVGGFDESFTPYGNEDVELSVRLGKAQVALRYAGEALAHQEYDKDLRGLASDTLEKGGTTVRLARHHPDAFDALRLASPRDNSRPWLAVRAILLRLQRREPRVAEAIFAAAARVERLGLWRSRLFYRALLDFAFWAGVDAEVSESDDDGNLEKLAVELNRAPIDHLLHG